MKIDDNLIEYCKMNNLDVDYMTKEHFNLVSNSIDFNFYKLGLEFKELFKNIEEDIKGLLDKIIKVIL